MSSEKIKTIDMPNDADFHRDYMCKLQPVVIKNFFKGEQIRNINSKQKVISSFGDMHIRVQDEYGKAYLKAPEISPTPQNGAAPIIETPTVSEYFSFVEKNPKTTKMCIEFPSPDALQATYKVPDLCRSRGDDGTKFVNQCFIGNQGNFAHVHFDKAGMHGFLYQVFGKKNFVIFPHSASHKLLPFTQIGGVCLQNFTKADRKAFLEYTGGQEILLDTGDCMFVPSLSWHYVDYVEDSMSISFRFRRPGYLTPIVNALFPDMFMQGIAYKLAEEEFKDRNQTIIQEITTKWSQPFTDGRQKVQEMRQLAKDIYARLYPEAPRAYYSFDFEQYFPPLLPEWLDAADPKRPRHI